MSLVPQSIYLVSEFVYSVLIPIYMRLMAVSCPGICFISDTQKILFKYTGAVRSDRDRELRRAKDRLKHNMQKPALLRPSLHIGKTPIMQVCESCSHGNIGGNMHLGQCWGCIYWIEPQHQQLPRYVPDIGVW